MLTPRTAKIILNLSLYAALVRVGFGALLTLRLFFPGQSTHQAHTSIDLSTTTFLKNSAGLEILIRQVSVPIEQQKGIVLAAVITSSAILFLLLFLGLVRLRTFVNRVIDDPFHPQNAADFRLASRVALAVQGLSLLGYAFNVYASRLVNPGQLLREALRGGGFTENIRVDAFPALGGFSSLLFPLLAAVILAVLATVFRRGHELRQEEQRLREEQVLTI